MKSLLILTITIAILEPNQLDWDTSAGTEILRGNL